MSDAHEPTKEEIERACDLLQAKAIARMAQEAYQPSPVDNPVVARLRKRYGRDDGSLNHHGDCYAWSYDVCTCGLLADLAYNGEEVQALFPTFWDSWADHTAQLHRLRNA